VERLLKSFLARNELAAAPSVWVLRASRFCPRTRHLGSLLRPRCGSCPENRASRSQRHTEPSLSRKRLERSISPQLNDCGFHISQLTVPFLQQPAFAICLTDYDPTSGEWRAPPAGVRPRRVRAAETLHRLREVFSARVIVASLRHHNFEPRGQPMMPWV
jgi:hypothetical protein